MSLFFKTPLEIEIRLENEESRKHAEVKNPHGRLDKLPIYMDGETVKGTITLFTKEGKRVEHQGVKVQLLGTIETNNDGLSSSNFLSLATELAAPGQLVHSESYPFEFRNVEKQYESYRGKMLAYGIMSRSQFYESQMLKSIGRRNFGSTSTPVHWLTRR